MAGGVFGRRLVGGVLAIAAVGMIPGYTGGSMARTASPHRKETLAGGLRPLTWMLTGTNIGKLRVLNPGIATRAFDNGSTFAIGSPAHRQDQVPAGTQSVPTLIFRSFAVFKSDLASGQIDPRIRAVVYDPEKWAYTPASEQQRPAVYLKRFGLLAHDHGYLAIEAPARDLMGVKGGTCTARPRESYNHAYLRCGLAADAARASDVVEIQAQANELNLTEYKRFVATAARQALSAQPRVTVLAGLSTGPACGVPSSAQLFAAAKVVSDYVSGYWMNVFASKKGQLETALDFLRSMRSSGTV